MQRRQDAKEFSHLNGKPSNRQMTMTQKTGQLYSGIYNIQTKN